MDNCFACGRKLDGYQPAPLAPVQSVFETAIPTHFDKAAPITTDVFDQVFEHLIGHEGGYVDDPNDAGGETKYGITKRTYPHLDIKNLTIDEAKAIYRRDFWQPVLVEGMPFGVMFNLFDGAVNSGIGNSIRFLQRAVDVADDGHSGQITRKAVVDMPWHEVCAKYNAERLLFMTKLSSWKHFSKGWARRIATNLSDAYTYA